MSTWESLVYNTVEDGPLISETIFNYVKTTEAIDSIAEIAGFIWNIDKNKKLWFTSKAAVTVPLIIDSSDMSSVSVDIGNVEYRNVQYIKGGTDITDPLTEYFKGDGVVRTWSVGFPLAKAPTVYLNDVEATVGIRGLDEGKQYYWSKASNQISQDFSETLLISTDELKVVFQGQFDVVVVVSNNDEIERMSVLEGGATGKIEQVTIDTTTTSRIAAFEIASSKIKKYAQISKVLNFKTRVDNFNVGMIITVTGLSEHGITDGDEFLINAMTSYYEGPIKWFALELVYGPEQQSWQKVFETMTNRNGNFNVRSNIKEDDVLTTLETNSRLWELTDGPNIFTEVYAATDIYPSTTLFPMFAFYDRIKYIELLDASSNVLVRKQVIKQEGEETGVITSTFYIDSTEGVGDIVSLNVYGGAYATQTNGSGVLHTNFALVKTKTSLEAIQIILTDTRNFTPTTGTLSLNPYLWEGIDDSVELLELNSI